MLFPQLTLQKEFLFLLAPITPLTLYQNKHLCGCRLNTRGLIQSNLAFRSQAHLLNTPSNSRQVVTQGWSAWGSNHVPRHEYSERVGVKWSEREPKTLKESNLLCYPIKVAQTVPSSGPKQKWPQSFSSCRHFYLLFTTQACWKWSVNQKIIIMRFKDLSTITFRGSCTIFFFFALYLSVCKSWMKNKWEFPCSKRYWV